MFTHVENDKTYFLTSTVLEWKPMLSSNEYKDIIISEWRHRVKLSQIKIYGFVIMPNHLHLLIRFLSPRVANDIKRDMMKWTARSILNDMKANHDERLKQLEVNAADRRLQFWERNSLAVEMVTHEMLIQKLNYIHCNPVQSKWNLAKLPEDYLYSSSSFYENGDKRWEFLTHFMD